MKVYTLNVGPMSNCTYIIENNGEGVLIDPAFEMDKIYKVLDEYKIKPVAVIFTHGHYDHVNKSVELLKKYNIKAYLHQADEQAAELPREFLNLFNGDKTEVLIGLIFNFMHTPGHSPGSVSIKVENVVFTGDTLFPGAIGRTDLPGSDSAQMQKSLKRLSNLLPGMVVYSGHSYGPGGSSITTIGYEVKHNPFLDFEANSFLKDLI